MIEKNKIVMFIAGNAPMALPGLPDFSLDVDPLNIAADAIQFIIIKKFNHATDNQNL